MAPRFRVLVVDDDPGYRQIIEMALKGAGYEVLCASDPLAALRTAYKSRPDAILLDVTMPHMDGYDVCNRLRELTAAPILFITARDTTEDVVRGFEVGADDYIAKPFKVEELISRLRARLRQPSQWDTSDEPLLLCRNSCALDRTKHELHIDGRDVYLTPREFDILYVLMKHMGRVLSAEAILAQIGDAEQYFSPDLVKQYIYRLRKKIELDPLHPQYLRTVRGSGYYFEAG